MKKIWKWLLVSNRWKHFVGGLLIGLGANTNYCAAYASLLTASALEFKDKSWGGKWDWIDFSLTLAGVIVGRLIRILI